MDLLQPRPRPRIGNLSKLMDPPSVTQMAYRTLLQRKDIYPLHMLGVLPGPDFIETARRRGDDSNIVKAKGKGDKKQEAQIEAGKMLVHLHRQALREPGFSLSVKARGDVLKPVTFVTGHLWGEGMDAFARGEDSHVSGPQPAPVMVIGKMPGRTETQELRCLVGESGRLLLEILRQYHVKDTARWYITNLVKFQPPDDTTTLKANWIADCLPLLQQELRIVRPKYILCLGSDASTALLGKKFNVAYMEGRVLEHTYSVNFGLPEEEPQTHTALVMTVIHPAAVSRSPDTRRVLERGIARFNLLTSGVRFDKEETDIDHRTIRTLEELEALLWEIDHDPLKTDKWISVDAEWQGEHPVNAGSYVRTIQLGWRPKHAACIVWHNSEGQPCFVDEHGEDARERAVERLNRFFANKRVCGHFAVADLEHLVPLGLTAIRDAFCVPLYDIRFDDVPQALQVGYAAMGFTTGQMIPAWMRTHLEGGWDTGLAAHAIEETAQLGLEALSLRYTSVPRYDIPLNDWRAAYCKAHDLKAKDLEGYGPCPDEILIPYANYDACATLRLMYEQMPLIDSDYEGNCCREPFWESMITVPPILEMHQNGFPVDKQRIDELTLLFMEARAAQQTRIQTWAKWPEFNIRSPLQVREFLYGERYNGKVVKDGGSKRVRPPGAVILGLEPILDTSKPPKRWQEIREKGVEHEHNASTNKTVLGALAQDNPRQQEQVQWLRDHRFIDQVLKSVLRPPVTDDKGNVVYESLEEGSDIDPATGVEASPYAAMQDNLGGMLYDAGLAAVICDDGRVRTHLYPTTETGRWRSARPALQNMCFDRETELLTTEGWIRADALRPWHKVAQYWPDKGTIDFVLPSARTAMPYRGSMIQIKNDQIDLLLTPNHRCLLKRRDRRGGTCFEIPAEKWGGDYKHLHAGVYQGGKKSLSADWVTFLCALQADGSYNDYGTIYFKGFSKQRKIDRLVAVMDRLGIKYSRYTHATVTGFYVRASDPVNQQARKIMPEKAFGPWLLQYDRATLDLFCKEVLFWDGLWTRKSEYSSSRIENADWIQILWTLSDIRARQRIYHNGNPRSGPHYCVNIPVSPHRNYSMAGKVVRKTVKNWKDTVFCVTVPSSFIVVRRNGKVAITGNSKRRDADYKRILGKDKYKHKIRSILKAPPGKVLVEADFKSAELYCVAIMSGDAAMLEHCRRNQLAEDDPDYYDIHSNVAVIAFGLSCPPTKSGLESIGKISLRIGAKNVIFGICYGRGAAAIALQCKEEGNPITVEAAQRIIDTVFAIYPGLVPFFEEAKRRVNEAGWICHCFGRFRRFPRTEDFTLRGEFERQGMNFPIQGMVGSAMDRAVAYLKDYRDNVLKDPSYFDLLLQIHDALILAVPYANVEQVAEVILPYNMTDRVSIWPTTLDGAPTGEGPFHLGVDVEVYNHWGEKPSIEECQRLGIPLKYAAKAA